MIDAAVADCVRYHEWVALQASGDPHDARAGMFLTAEDGGPAANHQPFNLTARSVVATWQSWKVQRGEQID